MRMTFRWFGRDDPIPLAHIRHIPGVSGVVSALYDVPVGAAWTRERLERLKGEIEGAGLTFAVVESIPVHEDIKLGRPGRERLIANYCESVRAMGTVRIPVLCYNFMPVFDWLRTDLAQPLADGSTALAYDDRALAAVDLSRGTGDLPGWATAYGPTSCSGCSRRTGTWTRSACGTTWPISWNGSSRRPRTPAYGWRSIRTTRRGRFSVCPGSSAGAPIWSG